MLASCHPIGWRISSPSGPARAGSRLLLVSECFAASDGCTSLLSQCLTVPECAYPEVELVVARLQGSRVFRIREGGCRGP
jgi:hypothetical protein